MRKTTARKSTGRFNAAVEREEGLKSNPFFSVKRERLFRKDKTDIGYDALYRADNGQQLSVVSKDYHLVSHREAVDFVTGVLDDLGIKNRKVNHALASNGAKLFCTVRFPDYKFNPADEGGKSTGELAGGTKKDDYVPMIVVKNSYDRSSSLDFLYGAFQMVCSNGVVIGDTVHQVRVVHSGKSVEFEDIREPLIENIQATIEGIKRVYGKLNKESGNPYLNWLIAEELLAAKYKNLVFEAMQPWVTISYKKDKETEKMLPVDFSVKKEFTAYLLYTVLTRIATHAPKSVLARQRLHKLIANQFTVEK